mgnify:FL=1
MKNWWLWIVGAVILMRAATRKKDDMRISKNFRLQEFVTEADLAKGVDFNTLENIYQLVTQVLQPMRDRVGFPIKVTSAYRDPARNAAIGGVADSQHIYGMAADIQPIPNTLENYRSMWSAIRLGPYDQLIWENAKYDTQRPSHLHVSHVGAPKSKYITNRYNRYELFNGQYRKLNA